MAITAAKRAKMEKLIYSTMDLLDPTKINTEKYKDRFKNMTDAQFDTYFKKMFANGEFMILDVVDYERDLQMEHIEAAAKHINVPLFEHVMLPFVNKDTGQPIVTKFPVPVGYTHNKRMQQTLSKKNTTSTEVSIRSAVTGQVTGKDKNARGSDSENFALATLDAVANLQEYLGPRADDMVMKNELYSDIARKGYGNLSGLTNDVDNKTTLNTVDVFLISMGLKSDLVTNGMMLKGTLNKKSK